VTSATTRTFAFNLGTEGQNWLTRMETGGTVIVQTYDPLNRVITRAVNGAVTQNVWEGWNLIEEHRPDWSIQRCYLQGANQNEMVAAFDGGVYTTHWFWQGGRGNTSHITGDNAALLERYTYDLSGAPKFYDEWGNERFGGSVYDARFLFAGSQYLPETGLYDMRNRFYSPALSRFLQTDPIGFKGDALNLYRYCGDDPVDRSDPMGLNPPDWNWSHLMYWTGNSPLSFNEIFLAHQDSPAGMNGGNEAGGGGKRVASDHEGPKAGLMPLPPDLLHRMYATHLQNVKEASDPRNWTPIPGTIKTQKEEYATGIYRKGNGLVQDGPNRGWHNGVVPESETFRKGYTGGGTRAAGTHVHVTGNGMHLYKDQEQAIRYHYISGTGSIYAPGRLDIFRPFETGQGGQYFHTDDGEHLFSGH